MASPTGYSPQEAISKTKQELLAASQVKHVKRKKQKARENISTYLDAKLPPPLALVPCRGCLVAGPASHFWWLVAVRLRLVLGCSCGRLALSVAFRSVFEWLKFLRQAGQGTARVYRSPLNLASFNGGLH